MIEPSLLLNLEMGIVIKGLVKPKDRPGSLSTRTATHRTCPLGSRRVLREGTCYVSLC